MTSRTTQRRSPTSSGAGFAFRIRSYRRRRSSRIFDARVRVALLADREQPALAEHHVDLAQLEVELLEPAVVHRDVEVVAVAIELGALVRVLEVVGEQRVELEVVDELLDLLLGGRADVDPEERRRIVAVGRDLVEGNGFGIGGSDGEAAGGDHGPTLR